MRRALKQAWELDDADKAERPMRNLARRFKQEAADVSGSILEGLDEIPTAVRLGLPLELRRSLAGTNIVEAMNSVIRQVCRNVKRWRDAKMALRWTAAGLFEARKGFRRIEAYKQRPTLKQALIEHRQKRQIDRIEGTAFSGSGNSEARFNGSQEVQVDSDGDGSSDIAFEIFGLVSATQLTAIDFIWS